MTDYKASVRRAALACVIVTACGVADEGEQSTAITADRAPAGVTSGLCHCAVTVDVYDDSCGAGCGQIGTTDWYTQLMHRSEYDCIQWCQLIAWYQGNAACSQFSPDAQAAYLHWWGLWGLEPYFFYDQLYACSDL